MIRLKIMMLIANGQIPAPKSSPACTESNPKSFGQKSGVLTRNARVINANAVVISAIKQPQNRIGSPSLLLVLVLIGQ